MSPQDQQACDAAIVSGLVSVAINQVHRLLPLSNELWGQACSDRNVRATQTHLARKRRSAPAGFTRVRIHKNEALLHQCFLVVERHSVQIDERLRINEKSDISELKNAVTLARLRIETNVVA